MAAPVIVTNSISPATLSPGQTATWRTIASDPDAQSYPVTRTVHDSQGNTVVFNATLLVEDPLTYDTPTSSDGRVTFQVDSQDPTVVRVSFNL